jgi:hypothetical protein
MKTSFRNYKHFGGCLWLENGAWEMGIPLSFGLRILFFARTGQENVFFEQPADADYLTTPEGWRIYGGTRLWFAPESEHPLYQPERQPISYAWVNGGLILTQNEDEALHLVKQIEISEVVDDNSVAIRYRVTNTGSEPLVGAPWAVSVMREGGLFTAPFAAESNEITDKPERILSLWNTTSLGDERLTFTDHTVAIRQKPLDAYFKLGLNSAAKTGSYVLPEQTFTKEFPVSKEELYPDGGVNLEIYCCRWMLEFETLAPMSILLPSESAEHTERWTIR